MRSSPTAPPRSAGILLFRHVGTDVEVLLIHPGGPFWRNKWKGAWQIPKGQPEAGESPPQAALREFEEELGFRPAGTPAPLAVIRQTGGKYVEAFALEGDCNVAAITSNEFTILWPPRGGVFRSFPEVDAARWFEIDAARAQILPSQAPLLDHLRALLQTGKV